MRIRSDSSRRSGREPQKVEKTIRDWEKQYPDTWILLEVTEEDDGEPVQGRLIATAHDPEELQEVWRFNRNKEILTMLTYGPSLKPGPEVVVSVT